MVTGGTGNGGARRIACCRVGIAPGVAWMPDALSWLSPLGRFVNSPYRSNVYDMQLFFDWMM